MVCNESESLKLGLVVLVATGGFLTGATNKL